MIYGTLKSGDYLLICPNLYVVVTCHRVVCHCQSHEDDSLHIIILSLDLQRSPAAEVF